MIMEKLTPQLYGILLKQKVNLSFKRVEHPLKNTQNKLRDLEQKHIQTSDAEISE